MAKKNKPQKPQGEKLELTIEDNDVQIETIPEAPVAEVPLPQEEPSVEAVEPTVAEVVPEPTQESFDEQEPVEPKVKEKPPVAPAAPAKKERPVRHEPRVVATGDKASAELLERARNHYGRNKEKIHWTKDECIDYLEKGILPKQTSSGNWVSDSTRLNNLQAWSTNELLDFVRGELTFSEADQLLVWEEAYLRWSLPGGLTNEEAKEVVLHGKEPIYVEPNLLRHDASRDAKPLSQYTFREVRHAILGNIQTKYKQEELQARLLETLGVTNKNAVAHLMEELNEKAEPTVEIQILEARLDEYKRTRTTTPRVDAAKVGDVNAMLLRITRTLIKKDYPQFKEGWNVILDFVQREKNTLFSNKKRFEHWDQVPLHGKELSALSSLIMLWCNTCDPVVRNNGLTAKQVHDSVRDLGSEEDIMKIVTYYKN